MHITSQITRVALGCWITLAVAVTAPRSAVAQNTVATDSTPAWRLPDPRDVQLGGPLGEAFQRGLSRLSQDPYRSAAFLRSDFSFEVKRIFTNYSGDISGRFIELTSLTSPRGRMQPETLQEVLDDLPRYQKKDGHFGTDVDWNAPLEAESPNAVMLPIFWGNSRLLVGLVEAHRAFNRPELLQAACRIGDFYIATADRFLDPAREPEYRATGTYAAGYPTDYFPGIEGLAKLYIATQDERYLRQAERMAEFFKRFDQLPIDHSHGNLTTHYGLLLLYEITGKAEYLERPLHRWQEAVEGGFVWPLGGVGEKFRVDYTRDEGCSEADWLRLNLCLWRLTGQSRFLDMAERLLWNHFAMNRTANGGYGHHDFICDSDGPLLMKPEFTEAVWCCTFHGLLGMNTLKSYLVAGCQRGLFINFPVDCSAPVATPYSTWNVTVETQRAESGSLTCRVRIDDKDSAADLPAVFLRRPAWAQEVHVTDAAGHPVSADIVDGYIRLPVQSGSAGQIDVAYSWTPRIENRRMQPLALDPHTVGRHRNVVLADGPHLLMANTSQPRPVVVALINRQGQLVLPGTAEGGYGVVAITSIDASAEDITAAAQADSRTRLAPWDHIRQDAATAFVFDLVTVPVDTPLGNVVAEATASRSADK